MCAQKTSERQEGESIISAEPLRPVSTTTSRASNTPYDNEQLVINTSEARRGRRRR